MKLSKGSELKLRGVHPALVRVVRRAAQDWPAASSLTFIVTCGVRTLAEQKVLVANRKSTTMRSRHIPAANGYSHAVDVAAMVDGKINWDLKHYRVIAERMKAAAAAEKVPIEWGGDWVSFIDGPHFQLPRKQFPGNK